MHCQLSLITSATYGTVRYRKMKNGIYVCQVVQIRSKAEKTLS